MSETCDLCDLPTPDPPVRGADGTYCCEGCAAVADRLDADDADPERDLDTGPDTADADGQTAYLTVEGMHCATCEAFVEATATDHDGVAAAAASYPTDVLQVVYDPDELGEDDLPGLVDGLGYQARPASAGPTEHDPEPGGRVLLGLLFGMMVMAFYVLFLYPHYYGVTGDALFLDVTSSTGAYLLGNIWVLTSVVLAYTGYPVFRGAYVSLRAGVPNMDLLVALAAGTAYLYSTVAVLLGHTEVYFDIAVVVVVVTAVGNHYEDAIKRGALDRLTDLTQERVAEARRRTPDGVETVSLDALAPGDELVVEPGERVPVDGTVVEGTAGVDASLVTGEAVPERRTAGDDVVGGSVVADGRLVVRVGDDAESTLDRLVETLWSVQSARPGAQRLADRIAAVFVPLVVVLGAASFVGHWALGAGFTDALLVGLAVLVVSCPCALGLATPLAVAGGVRDALAMGVVVTSAALFEDAPETDVVAFDKTGTLTTGAMSVHAVHAADDGDREALLARAAAVESHADHPIADAVVAHAPPADAVVTDFETHPGRGVSATVDDTQVVVGSATLLAARDWTVPEPLAARAREAREHGHVPSFVAWNGQARGVVVTGDTPRPEWATVVSAVADTGRDVVVITGDSDAAAARFRDHPDVDEVFAGVPPAAKAQTVRALRQEGTVAMVGDGSNDAPALAAADLGVAMASGTELAADAADAVVTADDLGVVPRLFDLTDATNRRIRTNLAWAFLYNAVAVPLAVAGVLNPLFAAVAMASSSLLVVGNSARSLVDADGSNADESATEQDADTATAGADPATAD
jgi:Cu2+-exporting ATPase